jgi:multiple sugar transport system permease protein
MNRGENNLNPGRILVFLVLLALMISMSYIISGQLFKFGAMALSAFAVKEGPEAAKNAAAMMQSLIPVYNGLAIIFTITLTIVVVQRFIRTGYENRAGFLRRLFLYEALVAGVVVVLFPFFWMLCTSFKASGQELVISKANPFDIVPAEPTLDNFRRVLKIDEASRTNVNADVIEQKKNFGTYFLNSLLVATTAAFLVTLFASMGAYVFSKKNLPFKQQIFMLLLATMMIPGMMFMVPQFFMVCKMGLFGTKWAMFLPHLASVFGIFMLKQFMDTIPDSLLEAAQIDGASEWQVFRVVIVPLAIPIILTRFC